jgi:hypothetical protein
MSGCEVEVLWDWSLAPMIRDMEIGRTIPNDLRYAALMDGGFKDVYKQRVEGYPYNVTHTM